MEMAVIKTGGKQYLVKSGDTIFIEKLDGKEAGDSLSFDEVLLVDNGSETKVGAPLVAGAAVKATVVKTGRAPKVEVVKYKAKSRYYKRRGHRQPQLKVKIDSIA
jgi:large subunit ribosomal protein L21